MPKILYKSAPVFAFSALAFSASALMAELPSSPLSEEYTVADSETIHGEWYHSYEVASGGVLNILGEYAQLQVNYAYNYSPTFSGEGIVNIGSDTEYGRMIFTSAAEFGDSWNNIINFTGTINVGERGDFSISGTYPSHYGTIFYIGTLNVNGTVSVMSATSGNVSYFGIKNLSLGANGMLSSEIDLQTADGGVYDIHGNGLTAPRIRVSTGTSTLNLRARDVLANLTTIDFESNRDSALKINAEVSNSLNALTFYSNSVLEMSIAEGQTFLVKSLKVMGRRRRNSLRTVVAGMERGGQRADVRRSRARGVRPCVRRARRGICGGEKEALTSIPEFSQELAWFGRRALRLPVIGFTAMKELRFLFFRSHLRAFFRGDFSNRPC